MDVRVPEGLSQADRQRLAQRYPPRTRHWPQLVVGLVLVGALLGWGIWAGWEKSRPGVHGQLYSYTVVSDAQVDVQVNVHRPDPSRAARCTVQAQAPSGETVGELDVAVPPSEAEDARIPASIKTYLRAHTAILTGCKLV